MKATFMDGVSALRESSTQPCGCPRLGRLGVTSSRAYSRVIVSLVKLTGRRVTTQTVETIRW